MRTSWLWLAVLAVLLSAAPTWAATIERVSVNSAGEEMIYGMWDGRLTPDGRYALFEAYATSVGGPGPSFPQLYLRDRRFGKTELISVSSSGQAADDESGPAVMTPDGRFVAFDSRATNLVPGHGNELEEVFLRDRSQGTTELLYTSTSPDYRGSVPAGISDDGRFIAINVALTLDPPVGGYSSTGKGYVLDRETGALELVTVNSNGEEPNAWCVLNGMSADGRFVVFGSGATNLVPGDVNVAGGIYLRDRLLGTTERVDVSSDGTPANWQALGAVLSRTGRFVLFASAATNLVPGDTNNWDDVFLRDRELGTTERVSISSTGEQGQAVTVGMGWLADWVSSDGRYVTFTTSANLLVPDDTNGLPEAFLRDRLAGTTTLVNPYSSGFGAGAGDATEDARMVAFGSNADDLVPGDTNNAPDVFVRDEDGRYHDVPSVYWAFGEVEACVAHGTVKGYADGSYRPKTTVTRGQMAIYIARALAGGDASVPTGPAVASFTDVAATEAIYKYVEYAVDRGVVTGYQTDSTYRPNEPLNRGQMAAFLARARHGGEEFVPEYAGEPSFADVPADFAFLRHVEDIYAAGITTGYLDGLYHPERHCLRDQMAVFLARAFPGLP